MGKYINALPNGSPLGSKGKAQRLLSIEGAKEIPAPTEFIDNLVCVVDNGPFEAAAWADSAEEMRVFLRPDRRPKTWLIVPNVERIAQ